MAGKSNYLEDKVLDHVLRNAALTSPTTVYMALYTSDPTEADSGTEVSGGSYARTAITFGAASGGAISNSGAVNFPTPSAGWGTVTHFGIRDASSAGNLLYFGALTQSKTINTGDSVSFPIGDIDVTED